MTSPLIDHLRQRLGDTEMFLAVEEAADRAADLEKIGRLRAARADLIIAIERAESGRCPACGAHRGSHAQQTCPCPWSAGGRVTADAEG